MNLLWNIMLLKRSYPCCPVILGDKDEPFFEGKDLNRRKKVKL